MTAAKIKALVWREWKLTRRSYLMSLLCCFSVLGFFWLVRLSMSVGNLAPVFAESELLTEFGGLLYYAAVTLAATILLFSAVMDNTVLLADMHTNWLRYSFALPIPAKVRATVSYTIKLCKVLIAVLLLIPISIFTAKITEQEFSPDIIWFVLAIAAVSLAYDTFTQVLASKARTVRQFNTAQVKVYSIIMLIMFIWMFQKSGHMSEEAPELPVMIEKAKNFFGLHGNIIFPLTVITLIVMPALGWLVCVRNYRQFGDVKEDTPKEKAGLFSLGKKKDGETA